ncbi:MAG: hypothetical protein Q8O22_02625 [Candidatus Omnitrophota bacterium]|nr:hypothetical protein [Candidatus Omnitrophota bacterium]
MDKTFKTIFLFLIIVFFLRVSSYGAVPHFINYQGRLADKEGKSKSGAFKITFKIYDDEKSGKVLWEETQSGISVQKGAFSVILGSSKEIGLIFDKPYWLTFKVENESQSNEPEMSPRQRITGSIYAIKAEAADNGVFQNAVIMWSGPLSAIPAGWVLCDGANGTPDLRDKFIVGARQDQSGAAKTMITGAQTQTGGAKEVVLSLENMPAHRHLNPAHTHTGPAHAHKGLLHQHFQAEHTHGIGAQGGGGARGYNYQWQGSSSSHLLRGGGGGLTDSGGNIDTAVSGGDGVSSSGEYYTSYEGSAAAQNNLPPYYALAFIMKK